MSPELSSTAKASPCFKVRRARSTREVWGGLCLDLVFGPDVRVAAVQVCHGRKIERSIRHHVWSRSEMQPCIVVLANPGSHRPGGLPEFIPSSGTGGPACACRSL